MHPKGRTLVKRTCVGERMLTTCPIDVKANRLMADRALSDDRVKALASRHLREFTDPNIELPHRRPQVSLVLGFDMNQVTIR
jgi:hypothetical protein